MVGYAPLGCSLALLVVDGGDLSLDGTHIVHGKPQNSKGQCTAKALARKLVGSGSMRAFLPAIFGILHGDHDSSARAIRDDRRAVRRWRCDGV